MDPETNTMKQFALMASSVTKCLDFTYDCPTMNANNAMPVLDTAMWIGKEQRETGIPREILAKDEDVITKMGELKDVVLYDFTRSQ